MKQLIGIGLLVGLLVALGSQEATAQQRGGQRIQPAPLTDLEEEWVTLIRIDEKLARDVYLTLHDVWGVPIFANIAAAEQTHMDAVEAIISKYGLTDPVAELGVGEFPGGFQTLDDQLAAIPDEIAPHILDASGPLNAATALPL